MKENKKMEVLLIQKQAFPYFGVTSISGYLKKHNHNTDCLIDNLTPIETQKEVFDKADIIGVSVLSTEHAWLIDTVRKIRSMVGFKLIIIGGIHAILYPEILWETEADMLCIGEGEEAFRKIADGKSWSSIEGIWLKDGTKNNMPKLIQKFDWVEDRDIYYNRYPSLKKEEQKQFITGRGCEFRCNFCFNKHIQKKFSRMGKYIRKKPVDLVIKEIEAVESKVICFSDDNFIADKKWIFDFLEKYRRKINKPFMCVLRADLMTSEVANELSKSGCHTVSMGVETGNEETRKNILNKNLSNNAIFRAATLLQINNIRIQTSNMFGIPGETIEDALKTIQFNIDIGTDFAFTAMLLPFPDTDIERIALEYGWLDKPLSFESLPQSFFSSSVFNSPDIHILERIKAIAYWSIAYPKLFWFLKKLIRLECRLLFTLINNSGIFFRYKAERKLSFISAVKMFCRYSKST